MVWRVGQRRAKSLDRRLPVVTRQMQERPLIIDFARIRADLKTHGKMIGANDLFIAAKLASPAPTVSSFRGSYRAFMADVAFDRPHMFGAIKVVAAVALVATIGSLAGFAPNPPATAAPSADTSLPTLESGPASKYDEGRCRDLVRSMRLVLLVTGKRLRPLDTQRVSLPT